MDQVALVHRCDQVEVSCHHDDLCRPHEKSEQWQLQCHSSAINHLFNDTHRWGKGGMNVCLPSLLLDSLYITVA